jgi:hypothetical protein
MRFKNKINILIFSFISILIFTECGKKYPDDPFITTRSSKRRLQKKGGEASQWSIVTVKVNGVDMTQTYNDSLQPHSFSDIHFRFDIDFGIKNIGSDNPRSLVYINYWNMKNYLNQSEIATWETGIGGGELFFFEGSKNHINDSIKNKRLFNLLAYNWSIRKLYNKYLIIKQTKFGNEYEVVFKR